MHKTSKSHQAKQNLRPAGEMEDEQNDNSSTNSIIDKRTDVSSNKNSAFNSNSKSLSHLLHHSGKSRLVFSFLMIKTLLKKGIIISLPS